MGNRERIAMEANRRTVQYGLDRRKQESKLDAFEVAMICGCNQQCESARLQRKMDEDVRRINADCASRIRARSAAKRQAKQRKKDAALGVLSFFAYTVTLFWLTKWTYLPVWGACLYTFCGAVFLAAYLCTVFNLLDHQPKK